MVFSLSNPAAQNYLLWHRFTMPTVSGTHDAVAVPAYVGDQLVSAYTFLLDHIVLLVWGIVVVIAVLGWVRHDGHDHPRSPLYKQIYTQRSSPFVILHLAARKFLRNRSFRWFISIWMIIALAFLTIKYAVPIFFARYIVLGKGAPVNPSAVFVPSRNNTDSFSDASNKDNLKIFDFYVPSALRAVGSIDSLNGTAAISPSLSINQPETVGVDESGGLVLRIGYRYNVTGLDFGLQDYPDLVFSVEGSCTTEYDWWAAESTDDPNLPGAYVDAYLPFNNPAYVQVVSSYDGGPRAFFYANPPDISPTNSTWGAIISSVNRTSWFPSTDPWYQTIPNPFYNSSENGSAPYMVAPQRPALSCWENDVWSYRGYTGSVIDLPQMPGLNLPSGLETILAASLGIPMIYFLGTYLQVSALKSSVTALANILDASSSSIYSDLERLVFASYIATVNCVTETTLFAPADGFLNDVAPGGVLLPGTGKFVIYSNDVVALSMRSLVIIPVITVGLWLISIALFFLPITAQTLSSLRSPEEERTRVVDDNEEPDSRPSKMAEVILNGAGTVAESEFN